MTIGDKLPPRIYVEVTGELADTYPLYGIGIKIKSVKNVDEEVRRLLSDWKQRCEKWQDEQTPTLLQKTHGGNIGRITSDDWLNSSPGHQCGIYAADTKLPHELTTIWRPASADKFQPRVTPP